MSTRAVSSAGSARRHSYAARRPEGKGPLRPRAEGAVGRLVRAETRGAGCGVCWPQVAAKPAGPLRSGVDDAGRVGRAEARAGGEGALEILVVTADHAAVVGPPVAVEVSPPSGVVVAGVDHR